MIRPEDPFGVSLTENLKMDVRIVSTNGSEIEKTWKCTTMSPTSFSFSFLLDAYCDMSEYQTFLVLSYLTHQLGS